LISSNINQGNVSRLENASRERRLVRALSAGVYLSNALLGIMAFLVLLVAAAYATWKGVALLRLSRQEGELAELAAIPALLFTGLALVALVGVGVIGVLEEKATSTEVKEVVDAINRQTVVLERIAVALDARAAAQSHSPSPAAAVTPDLAALADKSAASAARISGG
jgi:hypothetical protein